MANLGLETYPFTKSFAVDEFLQTSVEGLFLAGNILQVNDLVDNVSKDGEIAGTSAGLYALGKLQTGEKIEVAHDKHIRYTVPKYVYKTDGKVRLSFRTDKEYRRIFVNATSNEKQIAHNPVITITNGQIYSFELDKSKLDTDLKLSIEQQQTEVK